MRLNEIETRMARLEKVAISFFEVNTLNDTRLLIRAVRQLGRETMAWYSSRPDLAVERIDPDVLELIDETD